MVTATAMENGEFCITVGPVTGLLAY